MFRTCGVIAKDTEKRRYLFMRKVAAYTYRFGFGYRYAEIAVKLEVDRTIIIRDIESIMINEENFFDLLEPYKQHVQSNLEKREFLLTHTADEIKKIKIWLMLADEAVQIYQAKACLKDSGNKKIQGNSLGR